MINFGRRNIKQSKENIHKNALLRVLDRAQPSQVLRVIHPMSWLPARLPVDHGDGARRMRLVQNVRLEVGDTRVFDRSVQLDLADIQALSYIGRRHA